MSSFSFEATFTSSLGLSAFAACCERRWRIGLRRTWWVGTRDLLRSNHLAQLFQSTLYPAEAFPAAEDAILFLKADLPLTPPPLTLSSSEALTAEGLISEYLPVSAEDRRARTALERSRLKVVRRRTRMPLIWRRKVVLFISAQ